MLTPRRTTLLCLAALAVLAFAAAPALAQAAGDIKPPVPKGVPESPTIRSWVLVFLLAGACIGAALIPSKRGHQD